MTDSPQDHGCLVQLLLPLHDNQGTPYAEAIWESLKVRLVRRFGGVTAYTHTPAEGVWAPDGDESSQEAVFVVEVMAATLDRGWWQVLRKELEHQLKQDEIVIRALPYQRL